MAGWESEMEEQEIKFVNIITVNVDPLKEFREILEEKVRESAKSLAATKEAEEKKELPEAEPKKTQDIWNSQKQADRKYRQRDGTQQRKRKRTCKLSKSSLQC